jgi:hypothetical protein
VANIHQILYTVQEADQKFMAALWQDIQSNAKALGIQEFTWDIIERNLDDHTISYRTRYEVYRGNTLTMAFKQWRWQQCYDAVGPHNYMGCVEIAVGLRPEKDESRNTFLTLCYGSYYRRIAEFYPDYTTRYINSPKEAL